MLGSLFNYWICLSQSFKNANVLHQRASSTNLHWLFFFSCEIWVTFIAVTYTCVFSNIIIVYLTFHLFNIIMIILIIQQCVPYFSLIISLHNGDTLRWLSLFASLLSIIRARQLIFSYRHWLAVDVWSISWICKWCIIIIVTQISDYYIGGNIEA